MKNNYLHIRLKSHLLIFSISLLFYSNGYAVSFWGCFRAGVAETFVPGLGYALTGQVDKALLLGGSRWYMADKYFDAAESDDYEEDPDKIYKSTDAASGKEETRIYLNQDTWNANYYASLDTSLLFTTWGDLYQNGCEPNTKTYELMAAPLEFGHYYDNWMFWLPMLLVIANYHYFSDYYEVNYYLERGLTEGDLKRDSLPKYYMVGVGEEMFFRGTIQAYFFEVMKDSWGMSAADSRHASIFAASLVFAAAHTGAGFTANAVQAFIFGVYEGYVYHPSLEEFDLTTAIAIHTWWDILVAYAILNNAEFHEDQEDVYGDSAQSGTKIYETTVFPLLTVAFRF